MITTSEFSTRSSISNVPYDILLEIFTHCLPQYLFHHLQPDIMIAPILLCHVCSSWRMVALGSPTLWTHLSYHITILEYASANSTSRTIDFDERDLEFIQWWRMNQGSVAPFLSLNVQYPGRYDTDYIGREMAGDGMDRLLEYIASAQYLELDDFLWDQARINLKLKGGYEGAFSNLHTVVVHSESGMVHPFFDIQSLVPAPSESVLRRLAIYEGVIPTSFNVPNHWSTLTHFSLTLQSDISLKFWFSILRAVPGLRWAHFEFIKLTGIDYTPARHTLLPQLTTLSVVVDSERPDRPVYPLSLLFAGLHLPSMRTLTLSSPGKDSWKDRRAITELYNVLKSAPAITKLALEDDFLSLSNWDTSLLLAMSADVGTVWNHAAQLTHLQLDIPSTNYGENTENVLDNFVRNIFSPKNIWLNLQHPSCPIRTFAMRNRFAGRIAARTMSKIRKHSHHAPEVVFQITSDSASLIAGKMQDEWGTMN